MATRKKRPKSDTRPAPAKAVGKFPPDAWRWAMENAERGDTDLLRELLLNRFPENIPIPGDARVWLWNVAIGRVEIPKPRGVTSSVKKKAGSIRLWYEHFISPKTAELRKA